MEYVIMCRHIAKLLWCVLLLAATPSQGDPCPSLATMSDGQRLMLFRCLPFGSSPDSVSVEGVAPQLHRPLHGLPTAAHTRVFGQGVDLVLNFEESGLSSIGYTATVSAPAADSLFNALLGFYTQLWGPPINLDEVYRVRLWSTP